MKNLKFFLPLAALGLLASCSNDNLGEPANNGQNTADKELAPGLYLDLNLAVPTSGTRADSETGFDNFYDGAKNEYAVKDATLYLFSNKTGTNDYADSPDKCVAVIKLDSYFENPSSKDPAKNEITQNMKIEAINMDQYKPAVVKEAGKTYWALVILNGDGIPDKPSDEDETDWSTWIASAQAISPVYEKYFPMTNALGWAVADPAGVKNKAPYHLAKIDDTNLYYESEKGATVDIYVQRVASKVTIAGNVQIGEKVVKPYKVDIFEYDEDEEEIVAKTQVQKYDVFELEEWYLDVKNKKSFPVQLYNNGTDSWNSAAGIDVATDWSLIPSTANNQSNDRFVSGAQYRRMHWAVDPNYSTEFTNTMVDDSAYPFHYYTSTYTTDKDLVKEAGVASYCLENTFNVDNMDKSQTTRVVLKGKYYADVPAENFDVEGNEATLKSTVTLTPNRIISYEGKYIAIPSDNELKLGGKKWLDFKDDLDFTAPIELKNVFKDFVNQDYTGENKEATTDEYKAALAKAKAYYDAYIESLEKTLNLMLSSDKKVEVILDGTVYYTVLIRHFNDTELRLKALGGTVANPWTSTPDDDENYFTYDGDNLTLVGKKYPTGYDGYLLGRYGMLRNNWYELNISKVNSPGSISVPKPDNTPDDDPAHLLLDVQVHILAWAKRTQDAVLGQ